jgi:PAS domain S-box-containing protein
MDGTIQHAADDWVMLAAQISQCPIALIGIFEGDEQCFLATHGYDLHTIARNYSPDSKLVAVPSIAAHHSLPMRIIPDISEAIAQQHLPAAVAEHPLVAQTQSMQFYAAVPLCTSTGQVMGALSVWHPDPHQLTTTQQQGLQAIARQAAAYLEPLLPSAQPALPEELPIATQAQLLDLANDAILALDLRGRITFWNRGAENLYGWNKLEALGQDYYALLQPMTERSLDAIQTQCYDDGRWEGLIVHSTRDSQRLAISSHWTLQRTEEGHPSLILQINTPIRNYCDLDSIVQEERDRISSHNTELYNHLPDGFIAVDHQWRIRQFNVRAEQLFCCDRIHVLERPLWDALPDLADSLVQQECQRAMSQSIEVRFEFVYSVYGLVLEITARPHLNGLFLYLRDVTVHRKTLASLLEYTRLSHLNTAVSQVLSQAGTLSETLNDCVNAIVNGLDEISLARIWLFDPETEVLNLRAIAGCPPLMDDVPNRTSLGISIVGAIAQTRQPYLTNKIRNDVCLGIRDWAAEAHLKAFVGYPLVVNDRLVGVITLLSHAPIETGTYATLQWIFNSMAIAIDRSIARAELLSRREALLFRLASQIRNSLDVDKILEAAVQETRHILQIDGCHFFWCLREQVENSNRLPDLSITHESIQEGLPSLLGNCPPPLARSLVKQILTLEPIRLTRAEDAAQSNPALQRWMQSWGVESFLLIPIETHAGQLGAIACSHCRSPRHWTDTEVELLEAVTNQLAIAIDQAELFAETQAAAAAAQAQAEQLSQTLHTLKQTQAKMVQSEKMSSLGQLVAGIAHEINNPVGFVSGNLTYAENYFQDLMTLVRLYQEHYPDPPEDIKRCIHGIELDFLLDDYANLLSSMKMGTDRISKIVQSLRNFSRLDEADRKPVNIHDGIENTLLILQNRLKPCPQHPGITVIKQYGDLPMVVCHASQLNQVFLNIINNAIDALDHQETPRTITITTYQSWGPSESKIINDEMAETLPWVTVRIQDNGMGMSETVRQKIFDPFYTTKPVGKGTGLGLSISHQIIVENHHGWLSCESSPGGGTEFVVELPIDIKSDRSS